MIVYEFNLRQPVALMLFAAILAGLGAGPLFAQDAKSTPTSATSSHAAIKSNQAEHQADLTASTASEMVRHFGLPITNSMVVTWIGPSDSAAAVAPLLEGGAQWCCSELTGGISPLGRGYSRGR